LKLIEINIWRSVTLSYQGVTKISNFTLDPFITDRIDISNTVESAGEFRVAAAATADVLFC
jgi:hypothetical protein